MILQEMILRAALRGMPGDGFIFAVSQNQDRNQRSRLEERLKRLDTLAIGQKSIEQDRGDSSLPQPVEDAVGEPLGSLQAPLTVGWLSESLPNQPGIGGVVRDEKHG